MEIVAEQEIDGFDHAVSAEALGSADLGQLAEICRSLNVRPLTDFQAAAPDTWFDPGDGLETVDMLLHHLGKKASAIDNCKAIVADLEEFRDVLQRLEAEGIGWYLARTSD
ncbi:MAG: hypothetical protein R3200_12290 [Xanthomonadales bacterium]|nr:hypothetical protein [Xanthomonadales bacterium]